jgi:hypothetical protein
LFVAALVASRLRPSILIGHRLIVGVVGRCLTFSLVVVVVDVGRRGAGRIVALVMSSVGRGAVVEQANYRAGDSVRVCINPFVVGASSGFGRRRSSGASSVVVVVLARYSRVVASLSRVARE